MNSYDLALELSSHADQFVHLKEDGFEIDVLALTKLINQIAKISEEYD